MVYDYKRSGRCLSFPFPRSFEPISMAEQAAGESAEVSIIPAPRHLLLGLALFPCLPLTTE